MTADAIHTPDELPTDKDLLQDELDQEEGMIFEETRHTALLHLIDKKMVEFTTKINKKERDKIMRMLTFVRMYKLEMHNAMKASDEVKIAVLSNCNLYLEQIKDYFKLNKAVDGWTANEIFGILRAEEKSAKKWGIFGTRKEDPELET